MHPVPCASARGDRQLKRGETVGAAGHVLETREVSATVDGNWRRETQQPPAEGKCARAYRSTERS